MKKRWNAAKRLAFNALRFGVSAGLIFFLCWMMRGSLGQVLLAIKKMSKPLLALSFLFFLLGYLLQSLRFKFIMNAQRLRMTLKDAVSLTLIGQFFSNFLPTAVGGDLVKAYYTSKSTGKRLPSIACIMFDRLLGTFTLVLMALLTFFFARELVSGKMVIMFLAATLLISAGTILILFSRRIAKRITMITRLLKKFKLEEKIKNLYTIIYNYKKNPRLIFNAMVISFVLQIVLFYAVYLLIRGLNLPANMKMVLLFMPIVSTVSMVPSINGLGVRESAYVLLFGPLITKEGAFALSIVCYGLTLAVSLIGGIIYMTDRQYRIKRGVENA